MKVSNLFELKQGNSLELINMQESINSEINFVSRTSNNNGVVAKVDEIIEVKPFESGLITVALGGSVLSSFVQTRPFYTGFHIMVLKPKKEMTLNEKLYYSMCINNNAYKYGYGRQANKTLKDIVIPDNIPNWVKNTDINFNILNTKNKTKNIKLDISNWNKYKLSDLFDVIGTKTTPILELEEYGKGKYPYITTQTSNNGVGGFYNFYTEAGNVLTIDSAVAGYCSYQKNNFSASDHVEKLIPKFKLNEFIAQFIVTIINKENYKYAYGRKFNQEKIRNTEIILPMKDNAVDWNYIEQYIKTLPFADKV